MTDAQRTPTKRSMPTGQATRSSGGLWQRASRQVAANPLAAVAGAAAVSAGIALLLPASRRETEMMGEVAERIGEAARGAADSAIEAGKAEVQTLAQTALAGVGGAVIEQMVAGTQNSEAGKPRRA